MSSNPVIKWAENKYNRLLMLLFWLLVSFALPEKRGIAKGAILMFILVAMLSVIRQIRSSRWWLKFYTALVFVTLILVGFQMVGVLDVAIWNHGHTVTAFTLFIVLSVPIYPIQQEFFLTQKVTADTLKGGIAVYILMGVAWALFYTILFDFDQNSFSGIQASQFQGDFLHFSFVTLTTLGYGDIYPLVASSRIATNLEAIAGIMYPAILISRLVSLYNTHSQEPL